MDQIKETNTEIDVVIVPLDLSDNTSVGQAAKTFNSNVDFLDVLFNNAGFMATRDYTNPADGFEMHFASNDLGHSLLINLVTDKIISVKGVVINVSSTGRELSEVKFDVLNFQVGGTVVHWPFQIGTASS